MSLLVPGLINFKTDTQGSKVVSLPIQRYSYKRVGYLQCTRTKKSSISSSCMSLFFLVFHLAEACMLYPAVSCDDDA